MIYLYAIILLAGAVFQLLGCRKTLDSISAWDRVRFPYILYVITSFIAIISYACAIVSNSWDAVSLYAISYIFTSITVLAVLIYTFFYTGYFRKIGLSHVKIISVIFVVMTVIDAVWVISGIFTGNVLKLGLITMVDGESYIGVVSTNKAYIALHMAIAAAGFIISMYLYLAKSFSVPKMYRKKYYIFFNALILAVIFDAINSLFGRKIDIIILYFIVFGYFIFYYYTKYVPENLRDVLSVNALQHLNDGVLCYDIDGHCVAANEAATILYKVYPDRSYDDYYVSIFGDVEEAKKHSIVKWSKNRIVDCEERTFEITYKQIENENQIVGSIIVIHDTTEENREFEKQRYRAAHDELTGVYNRRYFCEKLQETLQNNPEDEYYLSVCNIHNFKVVNEAYGPKMGDEALKLVAKAIREHAKESSLFGRLQGDLFAILTKREEYDEEIYRHVAKEIGEMELISNYKLVVQFGVYPVKGLVAEPEVMIDRALVAVKSIHSDVNQVIALYDDKISRQVINEKRLLSDFEPALNNGEFIFFIQPQVNVLSKKVTGGEALVRWNAPNGIIAPNKFIPVFEKNGVISTLDRYVWEEVCKRLAQWKAEGHEDYYISVNISPKDMHYFDLYKVFTELVEKYDISPKNLHLEITETSVIQNLETCNQLVKNLRAYGFIVEMDDFGSGYSSLNMLKNIFMDTIKLDMGFLRENESPERGLAIVKAVISLAKIMDMGVICEGVETYEQTLMLENSGCDIFQGYYWDKPMMIDAFEEKYLGKDVG